MSAQDTVFFSPAQLQYLEEQFPEIVHGPNATEAAMRQYFGQRSVLHVVRSKTRGLNPAIVQVGQNDIPAPRSARKSA